MEDPSTTTTATFAANPKAKEENTKKGEKNENHRKIQKGDVNVTTSPAEDDNKNATDQSDSQELELQLRLDSEGRTAYDVSNEKVTSRWMYRQSASRKENANNNKDEKGNDEDDDAPGSLVDMSRVTLDYVSKTAMTDLQQNLNANECGAFSSKYDEVLLDCEISDCALLPRTFWIPAFGMKPRCALEQMALEIFHHHVPPTYSFDPTTSGAEWWVQLRPSPPGIGRYAVLSGTQDEEGADMVQEGGVSFHWDKDEDLRLMMGGTMYIHPHISTVTYLTGLGAPTMVLNYRVHPMSGHWMGPPPQQPQCTGTDTSAKNTKEDAAKEDSAASSISNETHPDNHPHDEEIVEAYLSWPLTGKHLSFDGRFLHAAPPDLMAAGLFQRQCHVHDDDDDGESKDDESASNDGTSKRRKLTSAQEKQRRKRRHRRVTFLVNIWLNYKPFNVHEFPESMLDKLSGVVEASHILFGDEEVDKDSNHDDGPNKREKRRSEHGPLPTRCIKVTGPDKMVLDDSQTLETIRLQQFHWPMGSTTDRDGIVALMPLEQVRQEMPLGGCGNVQIQWRDGGSQDITETGGVGEEACLVRLVKEAAAVKG